MASIHCGRLVLFATILTLVVATITRPAALRAASVPATTHVCGSLNGATTWDAAGSPYQMDCSVLVPAGSALTIDPGVVVYAANDGSYPQQTTLQIGGKLTADGTSASPITFASCPPSATATLSTPTANNPVCYGPGPGQWGGIQFVTGADSASSITYSSISDATYPVTDFPGTTLANDTFVSNYSPVLYDVPHNIQLDDDTFVNSPVINYAGGTGSGTSAGSVTLSHDTANYDPTLPINRNTFSVLVQMGPSSSLTLTNDNFVLPPACCLYANAISSSSPITMTGTTLKATNQGGIGVGATAGGSISGSDIEDMNMALEAGPSGLSVTDTNIENDGQALHYQGGMLGNQPEVSVSITHSNIIGNKIGFFLAGVDANIIHINNNNIYDNQQAVTVSMGSNSAVVDASNNWWGTTNMQSIQAEITDCSGNLALPCVNVTPILDASVTCTTADTSCVTPVPTVLFTTPTVAPAPSATITSTPAVTMTSTPAAMLTATSPLPTSTSVPTATLVATPTAEPTVGAGQNGAANPAARIAINPSTVTAGKTAALTVSGTGFDANETVTIGYLAINPDGTTSTETATASTASDGSFATSNLHVENGIAPGTYLVTATGRESGVVASTWLTIQAPPATATPVPTNTPVVSNPAPTTATAAVTTTPTAVATQVVSKRATRFGFTFVTLQHPVSWAGTANKVAIQANKHQSLGVTLTLRFPHQKAMVFHGHTNTHGYWVKAFHVPMLRNQHYPVRVPLLVQLRKGALRATRTVSFRVVA